MTIRTVGQDAEYAVPPAGVPRRGHPLSTLRRRDREALIGLAAFTLAWLPFAAWPDLDLQVSALFWQGGAFVGNQIDAVRAVYLAVPWVGRVAALIGLLLVVWRWCLRAALPGRRWVRRAAALALVMLLGVGVLVNAVLKAEWGRSRPVEVQAFGGAATYAPPWVATGPARANGSFVSGHAATGFALMAVGLFGSLRTRRRWCGIGIAAGTLVGLGRVMQGGHFLSDVVFAAFAVWITGWLVRLVWLQLASGTGRRRRAVRAGTQGVNTAGPLVASGTSAQAE